MPLSAAQVREQRSIESIYALLTETLYRKASWKMVNEALNDEQKAVLAALQAALAQCTTQGILDHLAYDIHPDNVNAFCDAVDALVLDQTIT